MTVDLTKIMPGCRVQIGNLVGTVQDKVASRPNKSVVVWDTGWTGEAYNDKLVPVPVVPTYGPGMDRMMARMGTGTAEALRQQVLVDQANALAAVPALIEKKDQATYRDYPAPRGKGRPRTADWLPFSCGDEVVDKGDTRHVGVVQRIEHGAFAVVKWIETGWQSTLKLGRLIKNPN